MQIRSGGDAGSDRIPGRPATSGVLENSLRIDLKERFLLPEFVGLEMFRIWDDFPLVYDSGVHQ